MSVYERFTFRGHTLDRMTIAALLCAEHRLGYDSVILQGSYNSGVGASAGTHDGGGALDLTWKTRIRKQNRALRKWACAAGWPREALPGVWNRHYHLIVLGNDKASAGAKDQMGDYRRGDNGLAGNNTDSWKYRPDPIRDFDYARAGIVSWEQLNKIAGSRSKTAWTRSGRRQIATLDRALRGFGMNTGGHKRGRMDKPLLGALRRFADIRNVGETEVQGPVSPKVLYELCVPSIESKPNR